jgi:hypothetical protein
LESDKKVEKLDLQHNSVLLSIIIIIVVRQKKKLQRKKLDIERKRPTLEKPKK